MNGKGIKIAAIPLAEKLPDLFGKKKNSIVNEDVTAHHSPSSSLWQKVKKGNEVFLVPAFSQIQAPFFQLDTEQLQETVERWNFFFLLPRRRHWNPAETHLVALHLP